MVALATLVTSCLAFAPTPRTPSRCNSRDARAYVVAFAAPPRQPPLSFTPPRAQRCEIFAFNEGLDDEKIAALFNEFDTDASGFIELDELEAALKKAGRPVSRQAAQNILERVDLNSDGLISVDEFKAVFKLAPGAIPDELKPLTGVSGFFLNGLGLVGDALGIDTRAGQWRTTRYGSRYVDDARERPSSPRPRTGAALACGSVVAPTSLRPLPEAIAFGPRSGSSSVKAT